jgi:hypothetical protein
MIAALFVETNGVYFKLPDVDPWDIQRDARKYTGPHAVVAHPPCERWGRYWYGGPMLHKLGRRKQLGADEGCFAAAVSSVRQWGGVLEHPEASHAWRAFGLAKPPRHGGWIQADARGWTCCVEQGAYGHRARKATWLYAVGTSLPDLQWKGAGTYMRLDPGYHSAAERQRETRRGTVARLPYRERAATPAAFRDVLLDMARSVTCAAPVLVA